MKNKKHNLFIKLPEISAKAYAEINGVSDAHINAMCRANILPARKLTRDGIAVSRDSRGIWFINLIELERIIDSNTRKSTQNLQA
jgi:hypothetical protein